MRTRAGTPPASNLERIFPPRLAATATTAASARAYSAANAAASVAPAHRDASADRPRVLSPYLLDHLSTPRQAVSEKDLRRRALEETGVRRVLLGKAEASGPALDGPEALLRALQASPGLGARLAPEEALVRALARRSARLVRTFTAYEGRVGRRPSSSPAERGLSASSLERLATCAYRVFFGQVLRLAFFAALLGAAGVAVAAVAGPLVLRVLYRAEYAAYAGVLVAAMAAAVLAWARAGTRTRTGAGARWTWARAGTGWTWTRAGRTRAGTPVRDAARAYASPPRLDGQANRLSVYCHGPNP